VETLTISSSTPDPITLEVEESISIKFSVINPSGTTPIIEDSEIFTATTPTKTTSLASYALYSTTITGKSGGSGTLKVYIEGKESTVFDTITVEVEEEVVVEPPPEPKMYISGYTDSSSVIELSYSSGEKNFPLILQNPPEGLSDYTLLISPSTPTKIRLNSSELEPAQYSTSKYYSFKATAIENGSETLTFRLSKDSDVSVSYTFNVSGVPVEEPVDENPTTDDPVDEPTNENPTTDDPIEEPTDENPTTDDPVDEPTDENPTTDDPVDEVNTTALLRFDDNFQSPLLLKEGSRDEVKIVLENPPENSKILYNELSGDIVTVEELKVSLERESYNSYTASILGVNNGSETVQFSLEGNSSIELNLSVSVMETTLFEKITEWCNFPITSSSYTFSKSGESLERGVISFSLLPKGDEVIIFYSSNRALTPISDGNIYLHKIASIRYSRELYDSNFYLAYQNGGEYICFSDKFGGSAIQQVSTPVVEESDLDVPQLIQ
jgi:hypothetical protein